MCIDIVYSTFLDKFFSFSFCRSGYYIPTSNTPCHMYALLSINQTIIHKFRRVTYHLVRTPIVVFTPCASNHTVRGGFFLVFGIVHTTRRILMGMSYPPHHSQIQAQTQKKKRKERRKKKGGVWYHLSHKPACIDPHGFQAIKSLA